MLAEILGVRKGVTAVIGGGGKTTLLRTLGEELARVHSPLVGELWQLTRFLIRAVLVVLAVECLWLLWKFA